MDPNATLAEIRALVAAIHSEATPERCGDLAELVEALDNWLSKGGFAPDDWKPPQVPRGPYGPFHAG
jgi:hypothetical protein